ncbi:unnamed protein product, partial [Brenthis ino]
MSDVTRDRPMAAKGPHDGMRRVREREHRVPHVTLPTQTKHTTAPREPASQTEARGLTATLSLLMIISSSTYCLNAFLLTTMFTLHAIPRHTTQ